MTRLLIIIQLGILFISSIPCHSQSPDRTLFDRLVASTKYFEGWHTQRTTPGHVGYGHKIQRGEHFPNALTHRQADSLLRSDLMQHYRFYTRYGKDALLLTALSYQIGPTKLLGKGKYPKSTLLTRLEHGDRDILPLYLSFCKWNGKIISSIRKRRWVEYHLLFSP